MNIILFYLAVDHFPVYVLIVKGRRAQLQGVIPHMAREYGFEYDLVTYKWPSWLHKQTEKQRIIWAYKILFLDVLFPLSLKKASSLLRAKALLILSGQE